MPALTNALRDDEEEVRFWAAQALGSIGPAAKGAEAALRATLKAKTGKVRIHAQFALARIDPDKASTPLASLTEALKDKDASLRRLAARSLCEIGPPAKAVTAALIVALQDPDEGVRETVSEALGQIGEREAVGPLIAALRDKQVLVRMSAAEALGKMGGETEFRPR